MCEFAHFRVPVTYPTYPKVNGYTVASTTVVKEGDDSKPEMVEHPVLFRFTSSQRHFYDSFFSGFQLRGEHMCRILYARIFAPLLGGAPKACLRQGIPECYRPACHCAIHLRSRADTSKVLLSGLKIIPVCRLASAETTSAKCGGRSSLSVC